MKLILVVFLIGASLALEGGIGENLGQAIGRIGDQITDSTRGALKESGPKLLEAGGALKNKAGDISKDLGLGLKGLGGSGGLKGLKGLGATGGGSQSSRAQTNSAGIGSSVGGQNRATSRNQRGAMD